jgi:hypothetical protein
MDTEGEAGSIHGWGLFAGPPIPSAGWAGATTIEVWQSAGPPIPSAGWAGATQLSEAQLQGSTALEPRLPSLALCA